MSIYVKTQVELDAIPLDIRDDIYVYIDFGTKENPAIIKKRYRHPVSIVNNSVVSTYDSSEVRAYDNSIVYAYGNSKVWAYDNSKVCVYHNGKIWARDNSIVYAYDNSEVCVWDNSRVSAYDNSQVWAHNDKCIVSINDNAIATSPSILCSGAELLNQCNGNVGNVSFTVSNVPDNDKDYVFEEFYDISERAFVLTMRGVPYYCVYNFNTMSIKFYTMDFCWTFENIADNKIFAYYLDNILIPALVNTKFDKSRISNII